MADLTVKGVVEWVLKSKGLREAVDRLKFVRKESDKSRRSFKMMGEAAASAFGRKLVGALGGAALIAFVKQSVDAFAQYERQLNVIERRMGALAPAQRATRVEVDQFLQSIEATTGLLRQDLAPQFQKLLGILGDAKQAMAATQLAANMAEAGMKDFGGAAEMIASLLQGELIEPAKSLGIAVRDANGQLRDAGEIFDELVAKYSDLGKATKDTEGNIGSMKASWNALVMAVGEGAAKVYNWISELVGQDALGALLKALKTLGPLAVLAFAKIAGGVSGVVAVVKEAASAIADMDFSGMGERLSKAWEESGKDWQDLAEGAVLELDLLWSKAGEQHAKDYSKAFAAIRDKVTAAERERREKERQKELEEQRKAAERRKEMELQAEEQLLQEKLARTKKGTRERLELELQMLDLAKERELQKVEESEEAKAAIEEKYRLKRLDKWNEYQELINEKLAEKQQFEQEIHDALLEDQLSHLQEWSERWLEIQQERLDRWYEAELEKAEELGASKEELEQLYAERQQELRQQHEDAVDQIIVARIMKNWGDEQALLKLKKKLGVKEIKWRAALAKAEEQIEEEKEKQRLAINRQVAASLFEIGSVLFGGNKSWAIAMALINTYQAITKALASLPYPANIAAAAATAVQGFAQVKKIRSQKKPQGFDDPVNDQLARLGGRRWAQDLVREISLGFSEGLREAAGVSAAPATATVPSPVPAVHHDEGVTVHLHIEGPVVGGEAGMEELVRLMETSVRAGRPWRYA